MTLKLYVDMMSQPCRALYIFMKMSKIPFEVVPVAIRNGEHKQETYLKLNPLGKVPSLADNDFVLTERFICKCGCNVNSYLTLILNSICETNYKCKDFWCQLGNGNNTSHGKHTHQAPDSSNDLDYSLLVFFHMGVLLVASKLVNKPSGS